MKTDREGDALLDRRASQNSIAFSLFALFLSLAFLGAVPIAMYVTGVDRVTLWENLFRICTSPSKLVTDYFRVGCLASTLFNASILPSQMATTDSSEEVQVKVLR